jgi:hypothetical protein
LINYEFTNDEIAKVLGVDAIIGGVLKQNRPNLKLAHAPHIVWRIWRKTEQALTMTLNNGSDGELLGFFQNNGSRNYGFDR